MSEHEELNFKVGVLVMNWSLHAMPGGCNQWWYAKDGTKLRAEHDFYPATDANHAREVEAEVERRGLGETYIHCLAREIDPFMTGRKMDLGTMLKIRRATPEQCCRAALKAVQQKGNGDE